MNLLDFDTRLPFTNCRIKGKSVDPSDYQREEVSRGFETYELTRSSLLAFASCPKKWRNGWKTKDTDSTDWGSLIDCRILTPSRMKERYTVEPDNYPAPKDCTAVKSGKCKEGDPIRWDNKANFCKDWKSKQGTLEIISAKTFDAMRTAEAAFYADKQAADLVTESDTQVWVEGEYCDKATKITVFVKTLIDLVPFKDCHYGNALADFKTTRSAHPSTWDKMVFTYGYDAQAAICLDLYNSATGEERNTFLHVIQENTPPYQTARRFLSHEFIALGRYKIGQALEFYCRCLKNNHWPDWDECSRNNVNGWGMVEPDPWMIKNLETGLMPQPVEPTEELQEADLADVSN